MEELQNISDNPYDQALPGQQTLAAKQSGRKRFWRTFRIARYSLILLLFPFAHYSGFLATDADKAQVLQLETTFHEQMARGDADGIYDDADQAFQNAVSREHHDGYLAAVAQKMGTPMDCEPSDTGVKYGMGSRMIRSKCTTRFSSGNTAIEIFVWKKTDNDYHLYSYAIKAL